MSKTFGVAGFPDQRTAKDRTYTHAIVGTFDGDKAFDRRLPGTIAQAKKNFDYYANGWTRSEYNKSGSDVEHRNLIVSAGEQAFIDEAVKNLRAYCSNTAGVLQWSMSVGAANRAVGQWTKRNYENVRVVEAFETKRVKGAPAISEQVKGW